MRVTIVNSYFPPWRGGAETYAFNLAGALVSRGHDVTVHCSNAPLPSGTHNVNGIKVVRHQILTRVYGTPVMPTLLGDLARADTDVFHGNFPSPYIAFLVAVASRTRGIPAVLTWHNDLPPVTSGARFLIEAHDRLILPRYLTVYRRIISTSSSYVTKSRVLCELGPSLTVIPNGVDSRKFTPEVSGTEIRDQLRLGDKFTLLFVGALTKWHTYKGLDILLKALASVVRDWPTVTLLVVGEGETKETYRSLSKSLGIQRNVIFVGDVSDDHLPEYYAACDALVLPSKNMSEGFGLTILEANATGKPVIASNVGGIPSVVRSGYNGVLVPPNDPEALSNEIKMLILNPRKARALGRNGRRYVEVNDWANTAAKTELVYKEALG